MCSCFGLEILDLERFCIQKKSETWSVMKDKQSVIWESSLCIQENEEKSAKF